MLEAFGVASPGLLKPLPTIAPTAHKRATSFLPVAEARAAMRRELKRLKNARQVQGVTFDDDGIGFVATLSDPNDGSTVDHAHWHNNAYWSRYTTDRVVEFRACLRLYRRDSVVCAFSRYPHREVRCFAEAMARADHRILEYKAAHGDELSAVRLGMIVMPARERDASVLQQLTEDEQR